MWIVREAFQRNMQDQSQLSCSRWFLLSVQTVSPFCYEPVYILKGNAALLHMQKDSTNWLDVLWPSMQNLLLYLTFPQERSWPGIVHSALPWKTSGIIIIHHLLSLPLLLLLWSQNGRRHNSTSSVFALPRSRIFKQSTRTTERGKFTAWKIT